MKLEYPKGLSPSERADAQRRLARLPPELAQQLLDELAARLKAGTIRVSPLVYLAGLIKRANAGKFVPEAALRVADAREKRRRNEAYLQRLQALNDQPMPEKTAVEDSPLARRLADIRLRSRGRGEDGGSAPDELNGVDGALARTTATDYYSVIMLRCAIWLVFCAFVPTDVLWWVQATCR